MSGFNLMTRITSPFVSDGFYELLVLLNRGAFTTAGLRAELGKDPHPNLGRLMIRGAVEKRPDQFWTLTPLGEALYSLGYIERPLV